MNFVALFYMTCPNETVAKEICRKLLQQRLITCANILAPMKALYLWQGALEESTETPVLLKGCKSNFRSIQAIVDELHPYEVPCLIELPTGEIHPRYKQWLVSESQGPEIKTPHLK